MKKLAVLLLLAVATVYGVGALNLSESGAHRFLDELETISLAGKSDEYCARLHDDLKVSIRDHSAEPPADFDGGRQEFCGYLTYAMKGLDLLGVSTSVQRENFTVTRSWLHPWTAKVSYHETRITTMSKLNATLRTQGDDTFTLVQTFGGVKILGLESKVSRVP